MYTHRLTSVSDKEKLSYRVSQVGRLTGREEFVGNCGNFEINSPLDWQPMKSSKRLGCFSPSVLTNDDTRQRVQDPLEFGNVRCGGTDE